MFKRLLQLSKNQSFFLFGARNTGKSTLIQHRFSPDNTLTIDLLEHQQESRFSHNPDELFNIVENLPDKITHVVIDEIQKVPKLLDIVHRLMLKKNKCFIMTGSSARKLKTGGANLLAGRAFVYHLFPLSFIELGPSFDLFEALSWGTMPQIFQLDSEQDKKQFLSAYAHTYLKEEIASEQIVRQIEPFRRFLEVAAQCNGKVVNFSNIARDTGTSDKTVRTYYQVLEDTLIGFFLEAYHGSFRKRLRQSPKFYFFDTGVVRELTRLTDIPIRERTNHFGNYFEHYIILECHRLASYLKPNYKFSYIQTKDNVEIDLVIERPGKPLLLIEIKSSQSLQKEMITQFIKLSKAIPNAEAICLSRDMYAKQYEHVRALPWLDGLKEIFEIDNAF